MPLERPWKKNNILNSRAREGIKMRLNEIFCLSLIWTENTTDTQSCGSQDKSPIGSLWFVLSARMYVVTTILYCCEQTKYNWKLIYHGNLNDIWNHRWMHLRDNNENHHGRKISIIIAVISLSTSEHCLLTSDFLFLRLNFGSKCVIFH